MLILTFLNSLLDVISLAVLLPLISLCLNTDLAKKNIILHSIFQFFGFTSPVNFTLFIIIATLCLFIGKAITSNYITFVITKFTYSIAYRITETNFNIFYNLSLNDYNQTNSTIYHRDIKYSPIAFSGLILQTCFQLISESSVLILLLIGMALADVRVLLVFVIVIVPVLLVVYSLIKRRIEGLGKEIWVVDEKTAKLINESVLGFIDIILLNKRSFFISNFMNLSKTSFQKNTLKHVYSLLPGKIMEVVSILGILIIYIFNSYIYHNSSLQLLTLLTVFAIASYRMLPSVNRILGASLILRGNVYILNNLADYIENNSGTKLSEKPDGFLQTEIQFEQKIELKNISYSYEKKKGSFQINNISLEINKGEKIGVIGKSGSGKTTLVNILLRFLIEDEGSIMVDGVKLDESNIVSWRQKIGYVQQNIYILDASIKENIAFGQVEIDEARLKLVIQLAQLSELVDTLDLGMDTILGEKGAFISGGQKQRIGIARALYRNAEILLLDEATNALDIQTEREINETIKSLINENITVIIIAHRITTLENCKRIYEMKEGTLIEEYDYNGLVNHKFN